MEIERLTKMAELLENLPETANFDMNVWFRERECGTVACAIGHAYMDSWFYGQGLRMKEIGNIMFPSYAGKEDYAAIAIFFGMDYLKAEFLFSPEDYKSSNPIFVAKRIRELLAENEVTESIEKAA